MKRLLAITIAIILFLQTVSLSWAWELERPSDDIDIMERTENAFTDGDACVGIGVDIHSYEEDCWPDDDDCVRLNVSMTANSRKGITYDFSLQTLWWIPEDNLAYRSERIGIGDDAIVPVYIPQSEGYFACRFYGGLGSAEYQTVYVSSNGFISFDNFSQPSPLPSNIPSSAKPNALVAAVWCDLNVDDAASIITGVYEIFSQSYFVILWNNVLHKTSGKRLTFEIILGNAPQYSPVNPRYSQSTIWISYKSVTSINASFAYGIEDQIGNKGVGGLTNGENLQDFNNKAICFYQSSNSFFLKRLTLFFQESEGASGFDIKEEPEGRYLMGHNVIWDGTNPSEPDGTHTFLRALAGAFTLLISISTFGGTLIEGCGLIIDTVLCGLDWADYASYKQYSSRQIEVFDLGDGVLWQNKAKASALAYDYAVDASISLLVTWKCLAPHVFDNSATVSAILEYYEYSVIDGSIINRDPIVSSVNLKIGPDDNNHRSTADPVQRGMTYSRLFLGGYDDCDFYNVSVTQGALLYVNAQNASHKGWAVFSLHLWDPQGNERVSTSAWHNHFIYFPADKSGEWTIELRLHGSWGFYSLEVGFTPNGMKTLLNGASYVPSVANIDTMKVELLYDDIFLQGDQGGTSPPHPVMGSWWPDGKVDGKDIALASFSYGTTECNSPRWSYMADVVPDRKIDGKDLALVARLYGKTPTTPYSTDLSGVHIIFNTGQDITPDLNGYVDVPDGASSFTVYRNATTIGTLLTLWNLIPP